MPGSDEALVGTFAPFPETKWPNTLRMQANSIIEAVDRATGELAGAPEALATLDGYGDREARLKASQIRASIENLFSAIRNTSDVVGVDPDAHITRALAETGLVFLDTTHPMARP